MSRRNPPDELRAELEAAVSQIFQKHGLGVALTPEPGNDNVIQFPVGRARPPGINGPPNVPVPPSHQGASAHPEWGSPSDLLATVWNHIKSGEIKPGGMVVLVLDDTDPQMSRILSYVIGLNPLEVIGLMQSAAPEFMP